MDALLGYIPWAGLATLVAALWFARKAASSSAQVKSLSTALSTANHSLDDATKQCMSLASDLAETRKREFDLMQQLAQAQAEAAKRTERINAAQAQIQEIQAYAQTIGPATDIEKAAREAAQHLQATL